MIPVSDAILGMEDLLGRYRQEGQVESTGAFTLDPKKAIEKLASFQLPGPHHWILKVVQTLDRSGATFVDISAGVRKVTVKSDAVPEGFTSIDDLLGHLLVDANHCDPSLRHLAAGLQGSLQTKPRRIGITMVCRGERRDYDLAAGGWREKGRESTSKDGSHFELILQRSVEEGLSSGWFALKPIFSTFSSDDRAPTIEKVWWCTTTASTLLARFFWTGNRSAIGVLGRHATRVTTSVKTWIRASERSRFSPVCSARKT